MNRFTHWILLNIFLPLSPFIIKIFIILIGKEEGLITLNKIANLPEIVFYSIYLCVVNLNINFDGSKGVFESAIRLFLFCLLVLNFSTLGMIYSQNIGQYAIWYLIPATIIPTIIAPFYKFKYVREEDM